ncbi:MAG: hypothetical protein MRY78_12640, partial [Saprospiraceae bacterium]|nr:hypothetical protein [Saprospiraceae bacterium]
MKYFILIIISFLALNFSFTQTTIGLSIGGDYMSIAPGLFYPDTQERVKFDNTENSTNSLLFGSVIEQHLSKKSYLSLSAFFSRKSITHTRGFVGPIYDKIKFDHQTYSIDFNWSPFNNFYLGFGGTYSVFIKSKRDERPTGFNTKSEYGALIGASYRYKGLVVNLRYLHSLDVIEPDEDTLVFLSPTKSVALSVS